VFNSGSFHTYKNVHYGEKEIEFIFDHLLSDLLSQDTYIISALILLFYTQELTKLPDNVTF